MKALSENRKIIFFNKLQKIMAEIITDQNGKMHEVASNAKANAGLTTGRP